jgi:membrane associated rhomboid family serine protease
MHNVTDWRSSSLFPASSGEWGVKEGDTAKRISEEDARGNVSKVSSQMGIGGPLMSSPSTAHFLPPIRVPEMQEPILSLVAHKLKGLAWFALAVSLLCALLLLAPQLKDASIVARTAGLLALVAGFWFFSYWIASHRRSIYLEWTIYLDWQRRFAGANLYLPLAVIVAFGLLQLGFSFAGHDRDELFFRFGVIFESIDRGEYWRFFVGPFLHADASHLALNLLFCLLVLPYLTPYRRRWDVLLLAYGAVVLSGVVVYLQHKSGIGSISTGGFAGISALIYFACGFALANTLAHRSWYPPRYATWLLVSTVILLASPHIVDGSISFTAHATGLVVGLIAGPLFSPNERKT